MAVRIELLRALVLLSSLAVLLLMLVLIGGLTMHENTPPIDSQNMEIAQESLPPSDEILRGKALFKQNCATCHNRNMIDDMNGPALAGVTERWGDYEKEDLYKWIRNSKALVDERHPRAVAIYKKWRYSNMNSFPNLQDSDIENILAYIER